MLASFARRWKTALTVGAFAAAALAVWVTATAGFLAHPGWLAAQKADFILGPVLVGVYWLRVRPASRFGPLLIGFGFLSAVYITQSSSSPLLFTLGNYWELIIYLATEALILAFPTGRLEGSAAKLIMAVAVIGVGVPTTVLALTLPQVGADLSLSGCRELCPENVLAVTTNVPLALDAARVYRAVIVGVALATIVLLLRRIADGTPPRRRALAIGTPVALLFLSSQFVYQGHKLLDPDGAEPKALLWLIAGARSLIWYGFLFALIAAQLFAARVLREVVGASMRRPSVDELERLLRAPLGDPGLRIGFWRPREHDFAGAGGDALHPSPAQALTTVEREGRPAAAILHDAQLSDDPELLEAAGGVALLAAENTGLERAWSRSLDELIDSRARLSEASDRERRKLERDLHDGAQQRLMGIQIKLRLARERTSDQRLADELEAIGVDAEHAVEEMRTLAQGIYPAALRSFGLADGLRSFALRTPIPVSIDDAGVGRCPRTVEAAIYFCAAEAVQNAIKHAGEGARVRIGLARERGGVRFAIADDGVGIAQPASHEGEGLIGMRDRIGAVGGELEIVSSPGAGTMVRGTVPLNGSAR